MNDLAAQLNRLSARLGPSSPGSADDAEGTARPALMFGWIAKGLLFLIIGVLGLELARRGYSSEDADQTGALATIAGAPAGRALVFAVSIGLMLYAAWQIWAAIVQESDGALHVLKRIGWVGLSLVYGLIAVTGLQIAIEGGGAAQTSGGDSGPTSPTGLTQRLFEIPFGRIVVVGIGIGTVLVGLYQMYKGVVGEFLDDIETDDIDGTTRTGLRALGTVGFTARATLLGIAGWLFVDAARNYDPERAAGIDDSLRTLASVPHGRILLALCGLGLAAAGLYDMVTFRRQRIDRID